ncbi:MAG: hypothetical protein FJ125_10650 [Deltaproteobacteria bacterium]|nr:hypothetical protein [Deltaproteobacteria bacterium]
MSQIPCPLSAAEVLQEYFLENRSRVLELAAFLDRLGRSRDAEQGRSDPRYLALLDALRRVAAAEPGLDLACQVQVCFSDPTSEPLDGSLGKSACGAWMGGWRCG